MQKISRSRLKCLVCGTILESRHRHDYVVCPCTNAAVLDGGLDYVRCGAADRDKIELLTEYVDSDVALWGVFNTDTYETEYKDIRTLEDSHVQNIALHLRTRYKDSSDPLHQMRFDQDKQTLTSMILPELERRGLTEVDEEIPW